MVGSHCRSAQLDRPDRPISQAKLDQLLCTTFSRPLLDRTQPSHDHSSTSTRQPPRSLLDHPNAYTISARPTRPVRDPYLISTRLDRPGRTEVMGYWSNRGRVDWILIGKLFHPDQTRSLHDHKKHFPINLTSTQPIPDHFPMASRAPGFSISTRIF